MNTKQRKARAQKMVQMRARGLTLEAIGQQFGLTRERVRRITSRYEIERQFTTVPELMARFGATEYEVTRAIQAAGLHRPQRPKRKIVIAYGDVDEVVRNLNLNGRRVCMICGGSFEVRGRSRKRLCSPECYKEHRRRVRKSPWGPMSEATRRIHELLAGESPGTVWVGFKEAVRLSGLSKMQLVWLRWRRIVATVPSGRGSWYSARHCELLGRLRPRS
jgi:hypothetical protein